MPTPKLSDHLMPPVEPYAPKPIDDSKPVNLPLLIVAGLVAIVMVVGQVWTTNNPGKTKPNITGVESK